MADHVGQGILPGGEISIQPTCSSCEEFFSNPMTLSESEFNLCRDTCTGYDANVTPSLTDFFGEGTIINEDGLNAEQIAALYESLNQAGDDLVEVALTQSPKQYTKSDMTKNLIGGLVIGYVLAKFVLK